MNKVFKGKNKNIRIVPVLFIAQIVLGLLPFLLLTAFISFELYSEFTFVGYIFIGIIIISATLNVIVTRRYNILLSGVKGERSLLKTVKRLKSNYTAFVNLPIRYKRGCSEIDLLLVGEKGIIAIEVKNHSGTINGDSSEINWTQRKVFRDGKTTEASMDNPFRQMKRQREILKSILRSNGLEDIWIESILYFSCENVRLRLNLNPTDIVYSTEKELTSHIQNYKANRKLTKNEIDTIISLFT